MVQSRRPPRQGPTQLPDGLLYEDSEWGLGVELMSVPGQTQNLAKAWGHSSSGGSLALHVPGQWPVVMALLLNRTDGWKRGVPQEVFRIVAEHAAGENL